MVTKLALPRPKRTVTLAVASGVLATGALAAVGAVAPASAVGQPAPFVSTLGTTQQIASTVPANGDVNPYGVAVVDSSAGDLVKGDILVSNFNDKANVQGTGTTIMQVSPTGAASVFAHVGRLTGGMSCPGGIGLTTALVVLPGDWVVVGSLPAGPSGALPDNNPAGCLIVLNSKGKAVETWSNSNINGPWDMTAVKTGGGTALFVSNALTRPAGLQVTPASGSCTVVRIDVPGPAAAIPRMGTTTVVGDNFAWKADKNAFVLAPTGLAMGRDGTLYVAETPGNHVTAIPHALARTTPVRDGSSTLSSGGALNAPLGMALAPNGDVIVANGGNGNVVEISPQGKQVATKTLVKNGAGDLFGLLVTPAGSQLVFVNDGTNALDQATAG